MHYFKYFLAIFILILNTNLKANAIDPIWKDICGADTNISCEKGIKRVSVDRKYITFQNNSIYYAVRYSNMNNELRILLLQYKNGKVGIVKSYNENTYEGTGYSSIYNVKEASIFKNIDINSTIHKVNSFVLDAVYPLKI